MHNFLVPKIKYRMSIAQVSVVSLDNWNVYARTLCVIGILSQAQLSVGQVHSKIPKPVTLIRQLFPLRHSTQTAYHR